MVGNENRVFEFRIVFLSVLEHEIHTFTSDFMSLHFWIVLHSIESESAELRKKNLFELIFGFVR